MFAFSISHPKIKDKILAGAELARQHGVLFTGNGIKGQFDGHGIKGEYNVSGDTISFSITKKPWYAPMAMIVSKFNSFIKEA